MWSQFVIEATIRVFSLDLALVVHYFTGKPMLALFVSEDA